MKKWIVSKHNIDRETGQYYLRTELLMKELIDKQTDVLYVKRKMEDDPSINKYAKENFLRYLENFEGVE